MRTVMTTAAAGALIAALVIASTRTEAQSRVITAFGVGSWIGVSVRDVTGDDAAKVKLPQPTGAYVDSVQEGSPAAKAGILAGDIVTDFDGERVRSAAQLTRLVQESAADRQVNAVVMRGTSRQTLSVVPATSRSGLSLPEIRVKTRDLARDFPQLNFDGDALRRSLPSGSTIGLTVTQLTDQLATYFGVKQGVLVNAVSSGTPAANAGVKAGDVITSVNGQPVTAVEDLSRAVRQARSGGTLDLDVTRERKSMMLKVAVPAATPQRSGRGGLTI
jgi:serine protease Do